MTYCVLHIRMRVTVFNQTLYVKKVSVINTSCKINEPPPTKYISKGFSPLHSRVLSLFDSLKDDHHQCGMDNLYNSAKFCRAAYQHERKVLCHGVTRKGVRGIPDCVKQEEKKSRTEQIKVRGTVKAAILMGDDRVPCLIACIKYVRY